MNEVTKVFLIGKETPLFLSEPSYEKIREHMDFGVCFDAKEVLHINNMMCVKPYYINSKTILYLQRGYEEDFIK